MNNHKYITVFGATGKIGSELITLLSQATIDTIAVTRNMDKAVKLPFVQWIQADIADEQSLYATMENSDAVFLLSGSSADFVDEQKNVIRVAKKSGVKHVVKLSSGAADKDSPWYIPRTHGEVEDFLVSSGMYFTMLRPNGIMQNWLGGIAESVQKERKFYESTGSGRRAHVDRRDIAEVAFTCLTRPAENYNKVYLLTSGKAVNYFEVAEAIGNAIGETVEYIPVSLEQARLEMEKQGMPPALIDTFIAYDTAQLNGETAVVSDSVSRVLGRPARTLENFARDYADSFR